MKFKGIMIILAVAIIMMGCQNDNNMEEGRMEEDNTFERTGYNEEMDRENRMGDLNDNMNKDNNNNRYEVADKAADQITNQIKEIDQAYVLTTDNNAYVAAVLDNKDTNKDTNTDTDANNNNETNDNNGFDRGQGEELTDEVKDEIKNIVQSADGDIDNVYITTSPDFADLTNNYITDMNEGRPVEGFFDQIGNAIERVFPQDKN